MQGNDRQLSFEKIIGNHKLALTVVMTLALICASCNERERISFPRASPTSVALPGPTLTSIVPTLASTAGGAWGLISGTGFEVGSKVTFGGIPVAVTVRDSTTMWFSAPAGPAGTIDVLVTNPWDGQRATLAQSFTFASPESFDPNGTWTAHAGAEFETDMLITIQGNTLKTVTCGLQTIAFQSAPVVGGEFSAVAGDGQRMTGRIVSPSTAVGTINVPPCGNSWWADKN